MCNHPKNELEQKQARVVFLKKFISENAPGFFMSTASNAWWLASRKYPACFKLIRQLGLDADTERLRAIDLPPGGCVDCFQPVALKHGYDADQVGGLAGFYHVGINAKLISPGHVLLEIG